MVNKENHEEEVDLFDLSAGMTPAPADSRPEFSPVMMETNVFSVDFDAARGRMPMPAKPSAAADGEVSFELAAPALGPAPAPVVRMPAAVFSGFDDDDLTDLPDDDEFPSGKVGLFAKLVELFSRSKGGEFDDDDLTDLTDDDDLPDLPDDDDDAFDLSSISTPAPAAPARMPEAVPPADDDDGFDLSSVSAPAPVPASAPAPVDLGPEPVFNRIAHVCLHVKSLESSIEFYSKLGFRKRFLFNRDGNSFGVYLEFGSGNFVELFEDASGEYSNGRLAHFCLETPDIDAVTASLFRRGIAHSPKMLGCDGTYQIWISDPDGNRFEIHQYTPDSSQIVGKDVEADW